VSFTKVSKHLCSPEAINYFVSYIQYPMKC